MSAAASACLPPEEQVRTDDALAYAGTIQAGLIPRERQALAAIHREMPCSVSAIAREMGTSPRTARRACEALEGDRLLLVQRTEAGYIVHPDAAGAVDAWAHLDWTDAETDTDEEDRDPFPWPEDVFPAPAVEPDAEIAVRAVESRRVPTGRGARIPFPVLDYVASARSLQAVKVALECGRRCSTAGLAEFGRGELARVTGPSSTALSVALAALREDGLAPEASATRVQLDLTL